MIKKRNNTSVNFSENGINCLKVLGYLNGKKECTDKSLSAFLDRLVVDFVDLNRPDAKRNIEEKILVSELKELQSKRDKLEEQMKIIALKIGMLRQSNEKLE